MMALYGNSIVTISERCHPCRQGPGQARPFATNRLTKQNSSWVPSRLILVEPPIPSGHVRQRDPDRMGNRAGETFWVIGREQMIGLSSAEIFENEDADQIGLNPAITIHDREDSAELMNLVRHLRGLSKNVRSFPA